MRCMTRLARSQAAERDVSTFSRRVTVRARPYVRVTQRTVHHTSNGCWQAAERERDALTRGAAVRERFPSE